jgi:hypothetical protein
MPIVIAVTGVFASQAIAGNDGQPSVQQGSAVKSVMDRSRLLVGAFYLANNLYDDRHVQDVADAGIDFLVAAEAKKELLDLCQKHKIGVIANSRIPAWWGDDGKNAGQYAKTLPLEKLNAIRASCQPHPALWGDYPVDEPNARDFAHMNAVIRRYRDLFPELLCFVNLYPIYANTAPNGIAPELQKTPSQLGTASYKEHIDQYVKTVDTDYICFDSYPFTGPFPSYLENLDIVGRACRTHHRDMWVIIQTGAWKSEKILTEAQIRWQSYLCLAYGTKAIMHACYSPGWWDEKTSCVNKAGEKNATYGYARTVNAELHALSDVFMKYESLGVYPCGNIAGAGKSMVQQLESQQSRNGGDCSPEVKKLLAGITSDGALIAGCFKRKDSAGYAVMVVNSQDPWDAAAAVNVDFTLKGSAYIKGQKTPLGPRLKLASGEGVFVTVD